MNILKFFFLLMLCNSFKLCAMDGESPIFSQYAQGAANAIYNNTKSIKKQLASFVPKKIISSIIVYAGFQITMDVYKNLKSLASKAIWGISEEEEVKQIMFAKQIQSIKEKELMLQNAIREARKKTIGTYVFTMKTLKENSPEEEKKNIEMRLKETLEKIAHKHEQLLISN